MGLAMDYNGTTGSADDGYSSGVQDLNTGHMVFLVISSVLVLLMIPGVGFFYSGLARRKSALQLILLSMISVSVVGFQWFFWGYSLVFSRGTSGKGLIGDLSHFGLRKTLGQPSGSGDVPDILFCLYQGMFASITPALAIGAVADRGRILPAMVFIFLFATVVYCPIAYWTWNSNGWLNRLGAVDFAGGGPVHVCSGVASLAYSIMLGKRHGYSTSHGLPYRPHSVTNVILGTVFLWVGWFGFNGGSALAINLRAVMACYVTNLAACCGAITWMVLDFRLERKWSTIGFCSGAVSGLVAITPAAGYVAPWSAVIIGITGGVCCNLATKFKYLIGVDDALDIFAVHGVGGITGGIMTGVFGSSYIAGLDGDTYAPIGWIEGHWEQMGYQLSGIFSAALWSFTVSSLILFLMNLTPGLSLRVSVSGEEAGVDSEECGEYAYDYVELTRHVSDSISSGVLSSSSSMHEKTIRETM
ncbi:hypothetical protein E4U13_003975 [Claviceps humidiphila]|uniref:Ammonium transporter n=1 Tax=Claviceps humidiphila TaxID=1294629 RepID=A0A9P7PZ84_9HYPO|nr:hypothetical protein E4U13_003975 [Claviceps humidiphila]